MRGWRHNSRCHRDRAEPMQAKPHSSEPVRLLKMFLQTVHIGQEV